MVEHVESQYMQKESDHGKSHKFEGTCMVGPNLVNKEQNFVTSPFSIASLASLLGCHQIALFLIKNGIHLIM